LNKLLFVGRVYFSLKLQFKHEENLNYSSLSVKKFIAPHISNTCTSELYVYTHMYIIHIYTYVHIIQKYSSMKYAAHKYVYIYAVLTEEPNSPEFFKKLNCMRTAVLTSVIS
jgi:hypothetical protein